MKTAKTSYRALVLALSIFLSCSVAFAQGRGSVSVSLVDGSTGEGVGFATVSLTQSGSAKALKYALSDENGKATMDKVPAGTYTLKAEILGYKTFTKEVKVAGDVDLGKITMDVDSESLEAAKVTEAGNPIIIKKDTIEYNASSFKTTDNDVLEDLLKKLPGVEVGTDGSITVNGKTIEKITIDGKTFFLDDPQLASKNLPASMINKVKVVQKKSEQAEFTGIDDGEEQTIIDLSVRPGMMNGLFGNSTAGIGHDIPASGYYENSDDWKSEGWRYQASAFLGKFSEKQQLSLIINANNTNNRSFNDLAGNMMGGMRGGGGFGTGNGITTSWMVGANGAWDLLDDKMKLGGNYVYNGTRKLVESESLKTTYLTDGSTLDYNTSGVDHTNSYGHRIGVRLEHKFSENTSILFEPQVNFGTGNFSSVSNDETYSNGSDLVSNSYALSSGNNSNVSTSGRFLLRQRLGIPGRTLTVNANYSFSNNTTDGFNQSLTEDYSSGTPTDSLINQRYEQNAKSASIRAGLTYTEPLGNHFYVEGNYSFSWNRSTSTKDTYDSGLSSASMDEIIYNATGEEKNLTYSNNIVNRYITNTIGVNLLYQNDNLRAQVGVGVEPQNTHNSTTRKGIEQTYDNKVVNFAPTAMVMYDISENANMRLFYRGRSSQPSTSQLMPVPDNTNPMNVSFGNPYLKPYFSHNLRSEWRYTNRQSFFSAAVNLDGGLVNRPISNASWYGTNGAQYSIPVNGPSSGNLNLRAFLNSPIGKSDFSISTQTSAGYSKAASYVGTTSFDTDYYYSDGEFDYELFHADFPDMDSNDYFSKNVIQSFNGSQMIRFTYRSDNLEATLGGRTSARRSWYTVSSSSTKWTFNNSITTSLNWTLPLNFVVKSDLAYNWYNGYSVDQDDEWIWGAEIQKIFSKPGITLSLRGYDILNQAKTLTITDSSNYHMESRNNTLGRYVILSLTWRFGSFGKGPGRRGFGGPGGRGGGPGGPGGGPGGGMGGPPPMM